MTSTRAASRAPWYRSFYFRIGFSFVVFVVLVLAAQSALFNFILARRGPFPGRSPNNVAAIVAPDIGAVLAQDPQLNLQAFITREYGSIQPLVVVMKDGRVASNRSQPLSANIRRSVDAVLAGRAGKLLPRERCRSRGRLRGFPLDGYPRNWASGCPDFADHAWMKAPRALAASNFRLRSASARSQSALERHRWRDVLSDWRLRGWREPVVSPRPMSRAIGDRSKTAS